MIFEKRGKFCFRDDEGKLHKFNTKAEAEAFVNPEDVPLPEAEPYGWQLEESIDDEEEA